MKSRLNYFKTSFKRYRYSALISFATRIVLFAFAGVGIGLFSAWYMIEKGSALTTEYANGWQHWFNSGDVGADPYTLAHMARSGRLPITSTNALYFIAKHDSDGERLSAECEYTLTGKPLSADWWSLAIYDEGGSTIKTDNDRSAINSASLLRYADGSYVVKLAEQVRSGNWIQLKGSEDLVMILRLYGIHVSKDTNRTTTIEQNLPVIKRIDCR